MIRRPPRSTLFPTRRSSDLSVGMSLRYAHLAPDQRREAVAKLNEKPVLGLSIRLRWEGVSAAGCYSITKMASRPQERSEEHTSELQSQSNIVCRLLLEQKTYPVLCILYLLFTGVTVWRNNIPVACAWGITNFASSIGIAQSVTQISAIFLLSRQK